MSDKLIIGYLADWRFYKGYRSEIIDYSRYDVINYSFFSMKSTGELVAPSEPYESQGRLLFKEIDWNQRSENMRYMKDVDGHWVRKYFHKGHGVIYEAQVNDCKVLASIGGWGHSKEFPLMAADAIKRNLFVEECVLLCKHYGFSGIDLDWEFPERQDKDNFTSLVKELRQALDSAFTTDIYSPRYKMVTCCFGVVNSLEVTDIYDIEELNKYLDLFNIMTYDQSVGEVIVSQHNSPTYNYSKSTRKDASAFGDVNRFICAGCPSDKITIGVAFYGRSFQGCTSVGSTFDSPGNQYQYSEILKLIKDEGYVEYYDEEAGTNYAVGKDSLISYDGRASMTEKAAYINANLLAGCIIWSMDGFLVSDNNPENLDVDDRGIENNHLLKDLRSALDA